MHDLSVEEVDDAVGKACVVLRVSNHDDRCTLIVQLGQQLNHFETVFRVEITCRLVGEDQLRVSDHGTCDGHTLSLIHI